MMESATQLLLDSMRELRGRVLWVVDEQIDRTAAAAARGELFALGNRCDVIAQFAARDLPAALSDFDLSAAPPCAHVCFRVAKEKAVVHRVINAALEKLPAGGTLLLAGYKSDGAKTYIDKAAARAQGEWRIERAGGALLGVITRGETLGAALDDQNYAQPRALALSDELTLWSKPGIFGWQKIDAGSAFLCEHLDSIWPRAPQTVLDLGCGYGYLTVRAAQRWPQARFVASDNNIAATAMCALNMRERQIDGRVDCCDCGESLHEEFDAILCNPPFHQGFAHEQLLTEKFLRESRRLLARGGRALFVVNQFIALEKIAQAHFQRADVIARNKSFKLVRLER